MIDNLVKILKSGDIDLVEQICKGLNIDIECIFKEIVKDLHETEGGLIIGRYHIDYYNDNYWFLDFDTMEEHPLEMRNYKNSDDLVKSISEHYKFITYEGE